jgi:thymidylate synthase (FAD)
MSAVKLISYSHNDTQSLLELVCYCARVSNPDNQNSTFNNDNLIQYLIRNKHWSPFEMVSICMEVISTRDISRQILRHRSFSFQEFSQRYSNPTESLGFKTREARLQDNKNRQNSLEINDKELQDQWEQKQEEIVEKCNDTYRWAIQKGIAKEQARVVLPEGNTMSKMYIHGTLRSWIHYLQIRTSKETQKEHREVAMACAIEINKIFPIIRLLNLE